MPRIIWLALVAGLIGSFLLIPVVRGAPAASESAIVFSWEGYLYAQSISTGAITFFGPARLSNTTNLPVHDVHSRFDAPLTELPRDEFGFSHGVWTHDQRQFAYLEIAPPFYRVRLHAVSDAGDDSDDNQVLIEGQFSATRGYLDPVGWTVNGEIVLIERVLLNYLHAVKVWRFDPVTQTLSFHRFTPVERLSGRTAFLPDGKRVFLGFRVEQGIGYLLDMASGQVTTFAAPLDQILPPARGFEYHQLGVLGALTVDHLADVHFVPGERIELSNAIANVPPAPFLHWPLPDDQRSITCYPDSAWTTANFDVTCPGMSSPRNYAGHQGTDVGGKPSGLPLGTPVYPSAPGVVVATYTECVGSNAPACNGAYGNTVTVEHALNANGEVQVWYTGYGHLQTVLVEPYAFLAEIDVPLALSGATGTGGSHLHFEVRIPGGWINPWDNRAGSSLWVGSNAHPLAAVPADEPAVATITGVPVLATCTSGAGNNIRLQPGTDQLVVGKTVTEMPYHVIAIRFVGSGAATGDWYQVQYEGDAGWLWSGLLTCR